MAVLQSGEADEFFERSGVNATDLLDRLMGKTRKGAKKKTRSPPQHVFITRKVSSYAKSHRTRVHGVLLCRRQTGGLSAGIHRRKQASGHHPRRCGGHRLNWNENTPDSISRNPGSTHRHRKAAAVDAHRYDIKLLGLTVCITDRAKNHAFLYKEAKDENALELFKTIDLTNAGKMRIEYVSSHENPTK